MHVNTPLIQNVAIVKQGGGETFKLLFHFQSSLLAFINSSAYAAARSLEGRKFKVSQFCHLLAEKSSCGSESIRLPPKWLRFHSGLDVTCGLRFLVSDINFKWLSLCTSVVCVCVCVLGLVRIRFKNMLSLLLSGSKGVKINFALSCMFHSPEQSPHEPNSNMYNEVRSFYSLYTLTAHR